MADHALTPNSILTGSPELGSPTLAVDVDVLDSTSILTGVPIVGAPSLGSDHVLTATDIITGAPIVQGASSSDNASYGTKYRFSFSSSLGRSIRVDVKQKNYTGGVNVVQTAGADAISIRREPNFANKLHTVYGTRCTVRFRSTETFEYAEFLAQGEDEYLVSVYVASTLYWSGYVLPDLFNLPMISKPVINLECADMLAIVSDSTFAKFGGDRFEGKNSFGEYLSHFFRHLNTDIDTLYDATEIRETSNADFTDSFLNLYYAHVDAFKKNLGEDNETWFTWGEVIDAILKPIGCCLELSSGAYHITRVEIKKSTHSRIPITNIKTSFDYGSSETTNPVIEWPNQSSTYMVDRSGFLRCDDIYKEQTVKFDTGGIILNSVVDGDFALDQWNNSTDLKRWTDDPTLVYERVDAVIAGVDVSYGVQITGKNASFDVNNPTDEALFSQPLATQVNDGTGNTIKFSGYFKIPFTSGAPTNGSTVYLQLIYSINSVNYYYDEITNTWVTAIKYLSLASTNAYNTWKLFEFDNIPTTAASGFSAADINVGLVKVESVESGVQGVQYTNIRLDFNKVNEYVETQTNNSSKDRSIVPDAIELTLGDAPSAAYSGAITLGVDPYAAKSSTWQRSGFSESKPLHELLAEVVMSDSFYNSPTFVLESTNLGLFELNSTLKYSSESLGQSIFFMTTGVEYNMKTDRWRGEWKEVHREAFGDNFFLLETGDFFLLETGDKLLIN